MYIRLKADGAQVLVREQVRELLGEDCGYIARFEQGEEQYLPAV